MSGFRTELCDLLGIEYPILQSGMGNVAGPDLVAEVCEAGGLGILASLNQPPDTIRENIGKVRQLTRRPFGVNLWFHRDIRPPADVATVPEATVREVQGVLNRFRDRLGLPAATAGLSPMPDLVDAAVEVILDERVPVWSIGLGDPGRALVDRCHARGIKVVAMVATVEDARVVADAGVDVIVAQGSEAGGHRSTWVKRESREAASIGTMALAPRWWTRCACRWWLPAASPTGAGSSPPSRSAPPASSSEPASWRPASPPLPSSGRRPCSSAAATRRR
jgi:nitronate monooxygenase